MAGRSSNAIDYSTQNSAARPLRKPERTPQKKNNVVRLPKMEQPIYLFGRAMTTRTLMRGLLVCAALVAIVIVIILNKVRLDTLNAGIINQEALLKESQQKYGQLDLEARAKVNIRDVEEYANNELGMQLPEEYQIEIMGQPEGDKTVLGDAENTEAGRDMIRDWSEISAAAVNVLAYLD